MINAIVSGVMPLPFDDLQVRSGRNQRGDDLRATHLRGANQYVVAIVVLAHRLSALKVKTTQAGADVRWKGRASVSPSRYSGWIGCPRLVTPKHSTVPRRGSTLAPLSNRSPGLPQQAMTRLERGKAD